MPKINRIELFRKFVKLLGKKYVYEVLDILMGKHPSPNNHRSFSTIISELKIKNIKINDSHLSNILKELMELKIIVKRKDVYNLRNITYYYTLDGFMLVNRMLVNVCNDIAKLYMLDLSSISIPNTISA